MEKRSKGVEDSAGRGVGRRGERRQHEGDFCGKSISDAEELEQRSGGRRLPGELREQGGRQGGRRSEGGRKSRR